MDFQKTTDSNYSNDAALDQLRTKVLSQVGGSMEHLEIERRPDGLILRGRARRYHDKQMAQVMVRQLSGLLILANDIEVV